VSVCCGWREIAAQVQSFWRSEGAVLAVAGGKSPLRYNYATYVAIMDRAVAGGKSPLRYNESG